MYPFESISSSLNYIPQLPDVLFPIDPELIVINLSETYVLVV